MNIPDKYRWCMFCKYFAVYESESDWSEYTPGMPGEMECRQGHWQLLEENYTAENFRHKMSMALRCNDYEAIDEVYDLMDKLGES